MKIDGMKGFTFPARELRLEEAFSVNLIARVINSPDRFYSDTDAAHAAGYAARPLPRGLPVFFNAVTEAELLDNLGIVYGKTLAAGLEVECGAIATERDVLVGEARVVDAYERTAKDGGLRQFLVLEADFHTAGGDLVTRTRVTFIERA